MGNTCIEKAVATYDKDADGELSETEASDLMDDWGIPEEKRHEVFMKLDADHSGKLTPEELSHYTELDFADVQKEAMTKEGFVKIAGLILEASEIEGFFNQYKNKQNLITMEALKKGLREHLKHHDCELDDEIFVTIAVLEDSIKLIEQHLERIVKMFEGFLDEHKRDIPRDHALVKDVFQIHKDIETDAREVQLLMKESYKQNLLKSEQRVKLKDRFPNKKKKKESEESKQSIDDEGAFDLNVKLVERNFKETILVEIVLAITALYITFPASNPPCSFERKKNKCLEIQYTLNDKLYKYTVTNFTNTKKRIF